MLEQVKGVGVPSQNWRSTGSALRSFLQKYSESYSLEVRDEKTPSFTRRLARGEGPQPGEGVEV